MMDLMSTDAIKTGRSAPSAADVENPRSCLGCFTSRRACSSSSVSSTREDTAALTHLGWADETGHGASYARSPTPHHHLSG